MVAIMLTGANGFIGQHLVPVLEHAGHIVHACGREQIPDIAAMQDFSPLLQGVDVVVHLAARVHVLHECNAIPLERFRMVNVAATMRLAEQAERAGVARFIFISTIGVHGVQTDARHPKGFNETHAPAPINEYATSKWEAEQALTKAAKNWQMELVILRPPLVYGAGVKANFLRLMQAVALGVPLPFGCVHNQRDMLYVGNFCSAVVQCITHPCAVGECFVLADGQAMSTPELVRTLAHYLEVKPRLLNITPQILVWLGRLTGKQELIRRLTGSLEVDASHIRHTLNWQPPFTVTEGIEVTAHWYKNRKSVA